MKVLILAAGYATRLYPLTINTPKPLLPVSGKPMIDHIMDKLDGLAGLDEIYVVTNSRFLRYFDNWASKHTCRKRLSVVDDNTMTNEERLGAIGDIQFVIDKKGVSDDLLIIAGDNLFSFKMEHFIDFAKKHMPSCSVVVHDIGSIKEAKKYGVVTIDNTGKLTSFTEKPMEPESTLVATCLYYFPAEKTGRVAEYLKESRHKDAPGNYISWLVKNDTVYGFIFNEEWYDIGDKHTYGKIKDSYKG